MNERHVIDECPMALEASVAVSPAREGGVKRLYITGTLIPGLTAGADSQRLPPRAEV
jgi:hypothetical protein